MVMDSMSARQCSKVFASGNGKDRSFKEITTVPTCDQLEDAPALGSALSGKHDTQQPSEISFTRVNQGGKLATSWGQMWMQRPRSRPLKFKMSIKLAGDLVNDKVEDNQPRSTCCQLVPTVTKHSWRRLDEPVTVKFPIKVEMAATNTKPGKR